jgi:hypothetical protein
MAEANEKKCNTVGQPCETFFRAIPSCMKRENLIWNVLKVVILGI